jgi:hypothetical protein
MAEHAMLIWRAKPRADNVRVREYAHREFSCVVLSANGAQFIELWGQCERYSLFKGNRGQGNFCRDLASI